MRTLIALLTVILLAGSAFASPERVDLNQANETELCTLPGIGPKRAQSIIDYRTKHRFTRISQLLNIRGIGRRTLKRLRPLVVIQPQTKPVRSRSQPKVKPKASRE